MGGRSLRPGGQDTLWFTSRSDESIRSEDLMQFKNGTKIMYLLLSVKYSDPAGDHYIHACRWVQPPAFNPEIWHFCKGWTDSR
jgi:hypothetical protein